MNIVYLVAIIVMAAVIVMVCGRHFLWPLSFTLWHGSFAVIFYGRYCCGRHCLWPSLYRLPAMSSGVYIMVHRVY